VLQLVTRRRSAHPPRVRVTFALLAVSVASFSLMQSMTVPVLPRIQEELGTDQSTVTWVLTAYLLSASVFTPIVGRLGDSVGKKRMLVASLLMLSVGSLMAALAPTIGVMIASRIVQGVGGGTMPLAFGIIRDEFPRDRVAAGISVVSSLTAIGFAAGIVVSGPIVETLGYRWLFLLPMVITALAAVGTARLVPESPVRTPGRVPLLPAVLLSAWLVPLLLAVSQAPSWGWVSWRTQLLLAVAAVVCLAWVRTERRVPVPLIDMRMMRLPGVWTTNLVALLLGVGMFASFAFLPQFNQTPPSAGYGFGASVTESGLLMLPTALGSFLTGLAAAPLARRLGPRTVVVTGCLLSAVGMLLVGLRHETKGDMLLAATFSGLGSGLAMACLATLIVGAVPPEQTGVATGMNANIRTIGGSIGSAAMASVVTSHLLVTGLPAERGYTAGFLALSATMALAATAGLAIPRVARGPSTPHLEVEPTGMAA
jgi:EmrB/QacA subfamily drug resistance transporter